MIYYEVNIVIIFKGVGEGVFDISKETDIEIDSLYNGFSLIKKMV